jgi:hypothetical protein
MAYFQTKKIPIWVNFGGSCNGRCWYILMAIWSILGPFGIFCGHLVYFPVLYKENLATLVVDEKRIIGKIS